MSRPAPAALSAALALGSIALALAAVSTPGAATTTDPRRCSQQELLSCVNGVGGGVTSLDTLRVTSSAQSRLRPVDDERGVEGLSGGAEAFAGWNVWGSWNYSDYESTVAVAPYEGTTHRLLGGLDRGLLGDRLVAGLSLGYENTDTDTFYNGGGQDRDGLTLAVYAAYLVNDAISVDAAAGYTRLNTDENRLDPANGATLLGEYDSDRGFLAANLNAVHVVGPWVFGARAGVLHAVESQDAYAESGGPSAREVGSRHLDLTQGYVGADVGYSFGAFEPYVTAVYRNDFSRDDGNSAGGLPAGIRTQPSDDDEWQMGLGVRYFGASGIGGSFEWLRTEGRDDFEDDTISLTVRVPL